MAWTEFWNGEHAIYVSRRHLQRHYHAVAQSIIGLLRPADRTVLDLGCGEALSADLVAARCERLYLCESASAVAERLRARFTASPQIVVPSDGPSSVPDHSIDLFVANSVVQYLSLADLGAILAAVRAKLAPGGRLVVADILPRRASAIADATSLLRFAAAEGFFLAAVLGLARTTFSAYPRLRRELGLLKFDEAEMVKLLAENGFAAKRLPRNLGHNQQRMTFVATIS
jgi:SAM-dependent methyltransferase